MDGWRDGRTAWVSWYIKGMMHRSKKKTVLKLFLYTFHYVEAGKYGGAEQEGRKERLADYLPIMQLEVPRTLMNKT